MQVLLQRTAATTTIRLTGDLDTQAAHDFDRELEAIVPALPAEVVIDLDQLAYLNSTGIRSFIRLDKQLKAVGKRFVFVGAAPRIRRIFQYCGLDTYFVFQDDRGNAAATRA